MKGGIRSRGPTQSREISEKELVRSEPAPAHDGLEMAWRSPWDLGGELRCRARPGKPQEARDVSESKALTF